MLKSSVTPSAMNRQAVTICHCRLKLRLIRPETHQSVGLDMGLADLAISSDGVKYGTFNAEWLEKQAVRWQRKYARRRLLNARCGSGIITALTIWKSLMIIPTGSVQESIKPAARNGLPISSETTFIS